MKILVFIISFLSIYSALAISKEVSTKTSASVGGTTTVNPAETRDCKVQNGGPEVVMYGLCYKEGNTIIFKSCAEFTCRLDKDVVAGPLEEGESSCFSDKSPESFKKAALEEHKVKKLSQIKNCGYGGGI